ncbi:MAG: pyridoxal phosphate-dependent aminotransferase [Gammaproteobacteria bacterium]|nr:MAG: pyridoxal phosphate-dependent aminotransferase [Gammaproteobacteria bacterium]
MPAQRLASITPFHVMKLLARARELEAQGRSVVHMEIGEPDFTTPQPVTDAGIRALQQGRTHYTPAAGLPGLREAIARHYQNQFGVTVDAGRILITPGASGALQLILAVLVDPGSQVLMADPGYPCNRNFVYLYDGEPVMIPVGPEQGYQLSTDMLEQYWTGRTRCVMLASPSNPTGTVVSGDTLQAMLDIIRQRKGSLIVDEIYQNLCYHGKPQTALALGEDIFVINSFSKYFGMTGWRLGWLVAPEAYVDDLDMLAQNLFLAASTPAQHAALAAFETPSREVLEQRRQEFQRRRDYLLPALRALGFGIPVEPQGAFYLYADCSRFTGDSFAFATDLLEKAGVAITPGIDFGHYKAGQHVRFAYTTSMEKLQQGVERLASFIV